MSKRLILFEYSISDNHLKPNTQLPKDDTNQQAQIGLTHLSCFNTEGDLQTYFYKCFPKNGNLNSIEVSVRKKNKHLFLCSHHVLPSNNPCTLIFLLD